MRMQEWIIDDNVTISNGPHDMKTLEKGTHVKPIFYGYLPRHIKDDDRYRYIDLGTHIFCATPIGIYPIPRDKLRSV